MINQDKTNLVKNIFDELNLNFYTFDEKNNQFIPKGDFGAFIIKECIDIIMKLTENNIAYEVSENSSIFLLKETLNSDI